MLRMGRILEAGALLIVGENSNNGKKSKRIKF